MGLLRQGTKLSWTQRHRTALLQTRDSPTQNRRSKETQHRSLTFSLEGCELKAESGILYRNGCITAHQESNESKNRQKEAWHVSRLFVSILFQVNLLQADQIMAKHSR